MNINKVRSFCRYFRVIAGLSFVAVAVMTGNAWFYLGIVPIIAGLVNFCPLCIITKKCAI
ncbi:MAG: hypothetical protein COB17_10810 [Sulfurimonas sp.]|nr:MAG: hypothetical protein COB17_10810 [Sulfurimonas sp.]